MCKNKVLSPALFRLFETGKRQAWSGARAQIIRDNELADERARIQMGKAKQDKKQVW